MSMISVHLTRKPGTARFLVAQRVEGNGVLQNEVPEQERPCLEWQLADSHRTFCLWATCHRPRTADTDSGILADGSTLGPFATRSWVHERTSFDTVLVAIVVAPTTVSRVAPP